MTCKKTCFLTALPVVALMALNGCSTVTPVPSQAKMKPGSTLTGTAAMSHAIVLTPEQKVHFCQQPQPDATYDAAESEGFTFINFGDKGGESGAQVDAEQEMEGRTPSLLLARELFYRLCEFSYNHDLDQQQAIELYRQNLAIIEKVSEIQAGRTDIKIGQTLINKEVSSAPGQATAGGPVIMPGDGRAQQKAINAPTKPSPVTTSSYSSPSSKPTGTSMIPTTSSRSSSTTYKSPWAK